MFTAVLGNAKKKVCYMFEGVVGVGLFLDKNSHGKPSRTRKQRGNQAKPSQAKPQEAEKLRSHEASMPRNISMLLGFRV